MSTVRAERIPPRADERDTQTLHFPAVLLADVQATAGRLRRSVSWCLHTAWCVAAAELECTGGIEEVRDSALLGGDMARHRVELPLLTWRHLTEESERLDRSKSWLLQRAWLIARVRLADVAGRCASGT